MWPNESKRAADMRPREVEMPESYCPVCRGETDPRKLLLETRCAPHLAEVKPVSRSAIKRAIREGMAAARAAREAMQGVSVRRGFFW
jgi:hypothetical protein